MSTWTPEWPESLSEVFRDHGHASFEAQILEFGLVVLLLAGEAAGKITFEKKKNLETDIWLSQKTLGR